MMSNKDLDFYSSYNRVKTMLDEKKYCITQARNEEGDILVWHGYFYDQKTVRLNISCSDFRDSADRKYRDLIGRVNCWLHYMDLLYFKNAKYHFYDIGGIVLRENGPEQNLNITKFKLRLFKDDYLKYLNLFEIDMNVERIRSIILQYDKIFDVLKDKKVCIWGYGFVGKCIDYWCQQRKIEKICIIDNKLFNGNDIKESKEGAAEVAMCDNGCILAATKDMLGIKNECEKFKKKIDIISIQE
jgi:hypothetical protein